MKHNNLRHATVAALALVAACASAQTGTQQVQVTVNGNPVQFEAAQPQMIDGRVLVPFRGVLEQMGATVDWDQSTQTIIANGNGRHVKLQVGSYDASVNGHVVTMAVMPQLINDSTMVPLRFLSEALGGHVDWQPQTETVAITTPQDNGAAQEIVKTPPPPPPTPPVIVQPTKTIIIERPVPAPPPPAPPFMIARDTVIPLTLDQDLNSEHNQPGDHVTATIRGEGARYLDFPSGTVVEGHVTQASAAGGSHGGTLAVRFTHIRFQDGSRYEIRGLVTKLSEPHIIRTDNGTFVAKGDISPFLERDAAIGAGAGLFLGSLTGKPVGGAVLGGSFGAIVGIFDHSMSHNVIIPAGTRLGLILNEDLQIDRKDLR